MGNDQSIELFFFFFSFFGEMQSIEQRNIQIPISWFMTAQKKKKNWYGKIYKS